MFLEEIFLTCTEKSSAMTNDSERPSGISTTSEIAVATHFHAQYASKTTTVFLHDDGEAARLLLSNSVSCTRKRNYVTRKHLFLSEKAKKGKALTISQLSQTFITLNHSQILQSIQQENSVQGWSM